MVVNVEALRKLTKKIKPLLLIEAGMIFITVCYSLTGPDKEMASYVSIINCIPSILLLYYGIRYLTVSYTSLDSLSLAKDNNHETFLIISFLIPPFNLFYPAIVLKKMLVRYGLKEEELKKLMPLLITYELFAFSSSSFVLLIALGSGTVPLIYNLTGKFFFIILLLLLYKDIDLVFTKQETMLNSIC